MALFRTILFKLFPIKAIDVITIKKGAKKCQNLFFFTA